ncbi:MAG: sialidase family protein [Victivallaceae bacterium]
MGLIKIIETKCINQNDSAFPTIVRLLGGDLICGFNAGGGPEVTGGSFCSRSADNGNTWKDNGCILPRTEKPVTVNSMRLSMTGDGRVLAYGQRNYLQGENTKFGTLKNEAVFCVSDSYCRLWSEVKVIPHTHSCPLEISNPIVVLADGRWLAPAALLPDAEHLGERVIVSESCDEGKSWNNEYTVFADAKREKGFFEQKIIETEPGKLLAFAWTVKMGCYSDLCNHLAWSYDGGISWREAMPTTIRGQTLSPFWLGRNRFLLVYNYRHSPQGIKLALADIADSECKILAETFLWRPVYDKNATTAYKNGIESFDAFSFGLPSVISIGSKEFLAVFWSKENDTYGINSIKFSLLD